MRTKPPQHPRLPAAASGRRQATARRRRIHRLSLALLVLLLLGGHRVAVGPCTDLESGAQTLGTIASRLDGVELQSCDATDHTAAESTGATRSRRCFGIDPSAAAPLPRRLAAER